jgi:hypothetical protein
MGELSDHHETGIEHHNELKVKRLTVVTWDINTHIEHDAEISDL